MPSEVQNFDAKAGGKWFRILPKHPEEHEGIAAFAEEFVAWIVSRLEMKPSVQHGFDAVHIHWIEPVETSEALKIKSECPDLETQLPWTDIIEVRCSITTLPCSENDIIVGYTPCCSKGRILIRHGLAQYCTFRAIADECYHVYQDYSRGCEWGRLSTNHEFAEEEAAAFADSLAVPIRRFLELRGIFHK